MLVDDGDKSEKGRSKLRNFMESAPPLLQILFRYSLKPLISYSVQLS